MIFLSLGLYAWVHSRPIKSASLARAVGRDYARNTTYGRW